MDVSPKSGETLIVCHISQIHSQTIGWPVHNSVQASRRPRSLNLTHSISLPERKDLPKEALDFGSLKYTSKSSSTVTVVKKGEENSKGNDSSSTLCALSENSPLTSPQKKKEPLLSRCTPRRQRLFIPESEMNEDEEDEDSDGDNLHKYHEGSSLQLHGNYNGAQSIAARYSTEFFDSFITKTKTSSSSFSQKMLSYGIDPSNITKESETSGGQFDLRDSRGTPILMDCDEQDWGDEEDYSRHPLEDPNNSWGQTGNLLDCEPFTQNQTDYVTDSSCNSSDGVLVNFSTIYNKTNNAVPATLLNLDSPLHEPGIALQDGFNSVAGWSSHSFDPNCNIYPLDSDISDLTTCLQSQARLAGSTQNYYKLVTCDLSSQSSPSPAWSSLTSFSETHSQGSCSPPTEYFLFGKSDGEEREKQKVDESKHQGNVHFEVRNTRRAIRDSSKEIKEKTHTKEHHTAARVSEYDSCNSIKTPQSQSWTGSQNCSTTSEHRSLQNSCPSHLDKHLTSPLARHQATSFAEIAKCRKGNGDSSSMKNSTEGLSASHLMVNLSKDDALHQNAMSLNPTHNGKTTATSLSAESSNQSNLEGACASAGVVRYTKAQRPTSLPIQPFVLEVPSGKQKSKAFGSLLNQYISHKYSKAGPYKATSKGEGHQRHMQASPLGSYSTIHLEGATSSDTCSTCTSSPILPKGCPQYPQPCTRLGLIYPNLDSTNRSPDMRTNMKPSPCSPKHTEDQNCPPDQTSLYQTQTPPAIREDLLDLDPQNVPYSSYQGSSPAITSVTSLTSITSLISLPGTRRRSLWPSETQSQVSTNEELNTNIPHTFGPKRSHCVRTREELQHGDSLLTDRPPEEFRLSPKAPSQLLSIDILHKRSMLKAVSLAVDLITAHFSSRQDPEEKIRLGNSSLCTSISQLVYKELCPTIQNILQDGLKAYKLDLIIGQRRNKLWNVVEATARPGSSTRMPDILTSVVKKCSQLPSHSMRLNVFIMDLLTLHALEFWIRHLYSCVDIVVDHYHQWGFLALSQGPKYGSLFQELLLLLQPLSLLPFDLYLPSELLFQCKQKKNLRAPQPQMLLTQSAQILQMSSIQKSLKSSAGQNNMSEQRLTDGFWLSQTPVTEGVNVVSCSDSTQENDKTFSARSHEDKPLQELRWARLFGSGTPVGPEKTQQSCSGIQRARRPSEWLKLGASKVDLLAQSVWTGRWLENHLHENHDRDGGKEEHIVDLKSQ